MSLEESLQMHEQWLRSIDSNLERVVASQAQASAALARTDERLSATNEALAVVAQNQSNFAIALASLTREGKETRELIRRNAEQGQEQDRSLKESLDRLEALIERYIRFRGNGSTN